MSRWLVRVCVIVAGFALGAVGVFALQQPSADVDPDTDSDASDAPADDEHTTEQPLATEIHADTTTSTESPPPAAGMAEEPPTAAKPAPVPTPSGNVLLAWTAGGLPDGLAEAVTTLPTVTHTTVVHGGLLELAASHDADGEPADVLDDGWVIPIDAVAIDPATYANFVPKTVAAPVAELEAGEALLSETSAALRGLGVGAELTFADGLTVTVAGVVNDSYVGGAEVVLPRDEAGPAGATPRYQLISHTGDRAELEDHVRDLVSEPTPLRLRAPGETPVLRHGDAVLTQAEIKSKFGEFAYRPRGDGTFEQDPEWIEANLTTADVPILGAVRCHHGIVPALAGALGDLERDHLGHTVDADDYAGCHEPRMTRGGDAVSRHAWGVAFDLNASANPMGQASTQDPELVDALERWGFTWGGPWLVPDPAHFEYVRPPGPGATAR